MSEQETRNKKQLLTVKELAEVLRVHKQTIYDWMVNGKIPYLKIGRAVRFDPEVINQWLGRESIGSSASGQDASATEEQLLTVKQVAEYLNLSVKAVYDLMHAGEIPFIRIGPRGFRLRPQSIKEWLERAA